MVSCYSSPNGLRYKHKDINIQIYGYRHTDIVIDTDTDI